MGKRRGRSAGNKMPNSSLHATRCTRLQVKKSPNVKLQNKAELLHNSPSSVTKSNLTATNDEYEDVDDDANVKLQSKAELLHDVKFQTKKDKESEISSSTTKSNPTATNDANVKLHNSKLLCNKIQTREDKEPEIPLSTIKSNSTDTKDENEDLNDDADVKLQHKSELLRVKIQTGKNKEPEIPSCTTKANVTATNDENEDVDDDSNVKLQNKAEIFQDVKIQTEKDKKTEIISSTTMANSNEINDENEDMDDDDNDVLDICIDDKDNIIDSDTETEIKTEESLLLSTEKIINNENQNMNDEKNIDGNDTILKSETDDELKKEEKSAELVKGYAEIPGCEISGATFTRVVIIGDSYLSFYSKFWPSDSKIKPYFIYKNKLSCDELFSKFHNHQFLKNSEKILVIFILSLHDFATYDTHVNQSCTGNHKVIEFVENLKPIKGYVKKLVAIKDKFSGNDNISVLFSYFPPLHNIKLLKDIFNWSKDEVLNCGCSTKDQWTVLDRSATTDFTAISQIYQRNIIIDQLNFVRDNGVLEFMLPPISFVNGFWKLKTEGEEAKKDILVLNHVLNEFIFQINFVAETEIVYVKEQFTSMRNRILQQKYRIAIMGDKWIYSIARQWPGNFFGYPSFYIAENFTFTDLRKAILSLIKGNEVAVVIASVPSGELLTVKSSSKCLDHKPIEYPMPNEHILKDPINYAHQLIEKMNNLLQEVKELRPSCGVVFMTSYPMKFSSYYDHLIKIHSNDVGKGMHSDSSSPIDVDFFKFDRKIVQCTDMINQYIERANEVQKFPMCNISNVVNSSDENIVFPTYVEGIFPSQSLGKDLLKHIKLYVQIFNRLCSNKKLSLMHTDNYIRKLKQRESVELRNSSKRALGINNTESNKRVKLIGSAAGDASALKNDTVGGHPVKSDKTNLCSLNTQPMVGSKIAKDDLATNVDSATKQFQVGDPKSEITDDKHTVMNQPVIEENSNNKQVPSLDRRQSDKAKDGCEMLNGQPKIIGKAIKQRLGDKRGVLSNQSMMNQKSIKYGRLGKESSVIGNATRQAPSNVQGTRPFGGGNQQAISVRTAFNISAPRRGLLGDQPFVDNPCRRGLLGDQPTYRTKDDRRGLRQNHSSVDDRPTGYGLLGDCPSIDAEDLRHGLLGDGPLVDAEDLRHQLLGNQLFIDAEATKYDRLDNNPSDVEYTRQGLLGDYPPEDDDLRHGLLGNQLYVDAEGNSYGRLDDNPPGVNFARHGLLGDYPSGDGEDLRHRSFDNQIPDEGIVTRQGILRDNPSNVEMKHGLLGNWPSIDAKTFRRGLLGDHPPNNSKLRHGPLNDHLLFNTKIAINDMFSDRPPAIIRHNRHGILGDQPSGDVNVMQHGLLGDCPSLEEQNISRGLFGDHPFNSRSHISVVDHHEVKSHFYNSNEKSFSGPKCAPSRKPRVRKRRQKANSQIKSSNTISGINSRASISNVRNVPSSERPSVDVLKALASIGDRKMVKSQHKNSDTVQISSQRIIDSNSNNQNKLLKDSPEMKNQIIFKGIIKKDTVEYDSGVASDSRKTTESRSENKLEQFNEKPSVDNLALKVYRLITNSFLNDPKKTVDDTKESRETNSENFQGQLNNKPVVKDRSSNVYSLMTNESNIKTQHASAMDVLTSLSSVDHVTNVEEKNDKIQRTQFRASCWSEDESNTSKGILHSSSKTHSTVDVLQALTSIGDRHLVRAQKKDSDTFLSNSQRSICENEPRFKNEAYSSSRDCPEKDVLKKLASVGDRQMVNVHNKDSTTVQNSSQKIKVGRRDVNRDTRHTPTNYPAFDASQLPTSFGKWQKSSDNDEGYNETSKLQNVFHSERKPESNIERSRPYNSRGRISKSSGGQKSNWERQQEYNSKTPLEPPKDRPAMDILRSLAFIGDRQSNSRLKNSSENSSNLGNRGSTFQYNHESRGENTRDFGIENKKEFNSESSRGSIDIRNESRNEVRPPIEKHRMININDSNLNLNISRWNRGFNSENRQGAPQSCQMTSVNDFKSDSHGSRYRDYSKESQLSQSEIHPSLNTSRNIASIDDRPIYNMNNSNAPHGSQWNSGFNNGSRQASSLVRSAMDTRNSHAVRSGISREAQQASSEICPSSDALRKLALIGDRLTANKNSDSGSYSPQGNVGFNSGTKHSPSEGRPSLNASNSFAKVGDCQMVNVNNSGIAYESQRNKDFGIVTQYAGNTDSVSNSSQINRVSFTENSQRFNVQPRNFQSNGHSVTNNNFSSREQQHFMTADHSNYLAVPNANMTNSFGNYGPQHSTINNFASSEYNQITNIQANNEVPRDIQRTREYSSSTLQSSSSSLENNRYYTNFSTPSFGGQQLANDRLGHFNVIPSDQQWNTNVDTRYIAPEAGIFQSSTSIGHQVNEQSQDHAAATWVLR